ncbi:MAG: hypothetical protein ACI934_000805, partial [Pseudohongiellaceae bacterium]
MSQKKWGKPIKLVFAAFTIGLLFSAESFAQVLPDFTSLVDENASAIVNVNSITRTNLDTGDNEERLDEILRYYFGDRVPEIPEEQMREFEQRPSLG